MAEQMAPERDRPSRATPSTRARLPTRLAVRAELAAARAEQQAATAEILRVIASGADRSASRVLEPIVESAGHARRVPIRRRALASRWRYGDGHRAGSSTASSAATLDRGDHDASTPSLECRPMSAILAARSRGMTQE